KGTGASNGKIIPSSQKHAINTKGTGSNNGRMVNNTPDNNTSILSPRDNSSGLPSGKRMHKPFKVLDNEFDINTKNIINEDGKLYAEVINEREAGSGMATGMMLITGDVGGDGLSDYEIVSPRDPASGMATGKRMHKPITVTKELDAYDHEIVSPRDPASGMATGKRMHKPITVTKELDAYDHEIVSPRDPASGMATGKRMHKPITVTKELDAYNHEIVSPRYPASGMATGKRMHKPVGIMQETGLDNKAFSINGSNGKTHDIFIPNGLMIVSGKTPKLVPFNEYKIGPLKWMAPESLNHGSERKGWDGTVKGNGISSSERKGWDGTVKGGGISSSERKGITEKGIKKNKVEVKGWDMKEKSKEDEAQNIQKATVNTSRSNIKHMSRINCLGGSCAIECVVEIKGTEFDAVITGSFKSITDSKKSLMGIIR
ncbi:MAG: hypothetical protein ABIO81_00495, partial [Ginsengibacter sp.]